MVVSLNSRLESNNEEEEDDLCESPVANADQDTQVLITPRMGASGCTLGPYCPTLGPCCPSVTDNTVQLITQSYLQGPRGRAVHDVSRLGVSRWG